MRSLLRGGGYLLRGIRTFAATPSVWPLGLLPVVIALVVVGGALTLLAINLDHVAAALTPSADAWSQSARDTARFVVGAALLLGGVFLAVLCFATLTNLIGQPFYEALSDRVERSLGATPPPPGPPWWRTLPRATAESLVLLVVGIGAGIVLLALNLVPVAGQVVAALVWGYLLAVELLAIPLQRRGLFLRDRLRLLWRHRLLVTGFGVTAFVLFLIPLMNIVAMPGAVVGGTLLVRHIDGQASTPRPERAA
jgi:CysZ protein